MKTILLMDIVIVFVGIYLAVSAAKNEKKADRSVTWLSRKKKLRSVKIPRRISGE